MTKGESTEENRDSRPALRYRAHRSAGQTSRRSATLPGSGHSVGLCASVTHSKPLEDKGAIRTHHCISGTLVESGAENKAAELRDPFGTVPSLPKP